MAFFVFVDSNITITKTWIIANDHALVDYVTVYSANDIHITLSTGKK